MTLLVSDSIKIMKALADSSRLMILNSLFEKPQYVEELSERLNLSPSTISFHLKKLEDVKLVIKEKKQYYSEFHINKAIFDSPLKELTTFKNMEKYVQDERVKKYKDKVINTFFENGRLKQMPAQLKKRIIIFEWFADKFETGMDYSEQEVSDFIGKYYDDYCLVRRELVDRKYMSRRNQIYRKLQD
jgi:ArsR family transcriptional regulator